MLIRSKKVLSLWLVSLVCACLLTFSGSAYALNIWTTDISCSPQQKNSYLQGETVNIRVENLDANTTYSWRIEGNPGSADPNETIAFGEFDTDGDGYACFPAYVVGSDGDADSGVYKVYAGPYQKTYQVVAAEPAISVTKTVGIVNGVCAATSDITVAAGTTVYYCYTVTNNGDVTLNIHDLVDDQLGPIFTGFNYALAPGASVSTVQAGLTIDEEINTTTTNTATWTAYNTGGADQTTAIDSATVTVEQSTTPSIRVTKTVGTTPGVCAGTDAITVVSGTTVYYCYTVTNTGDVTLNYHDLVDDQLGPIFTGLNYALAPGASVSTVQAGLTIDEEINTTTTNTATWTAYNEDDAIRMDEVTALDSAKVTVRSTAIPTLSEWGMIIMSLLLAGSAVWMIRRRQMV
jgi:hypothetical protein